jgi:hypothetical protein
MKWHNRSQVNLTSDIMGIHPRAEVDTTCF